MPSFLLAVSCHKRFYYSRKVKHNWSYSDVEDFPLSDCIWQERRCQVENMSVYVLFILHLKSNKATQCVYQTSWHLNLQLNRNQQYRLQTWEKKVHKSKLELTLMMTGWRKVQLVVRSFILNENLIRFLTSDKLFMSRKTETELC